MSALGDRLRERSASYDSIASNSWDDGVKDGYDFAADLADEHEAAALAESAQGRGPHAAAVLRWAAERADSEDAIPGTHLVTGAILHRWASEAERAQDPTLAAFAAQGGGS